MNERKPKHKRDYTIHTVLAYTPLTMDECIDRLRGGHFPIKSVDVHIQARDQQVTVELLMWQWPGPVRFEAAFTPSENGLTRVHGQIKQALTLSYRVFAAQFFVLGALGVTLLLAFSGERLPADNDDLNAFALLWGIIMISVLIAFTINKRRAGRLTRALQSWLTNRLDI